MDAEFSTQYRVMKALADGGAAVPLPPLGFYEEDPQYLGVPFFTMDHVEGKVPSDNIPYTMEGWVIEATPEQQARMWWSGVDALAAVHRTDWRALGLDWLGMAGRGKPGIEQQMSYYRDFLDWAAQGRAGSRSSRRPGSGWSTTSRRRRARSCSAGATAGSATSSGTTSRRWPCSTGRWRRSASPRWTWAGTSTSTASSPTRSACRARPGFGSHEETIERYSELLGRPMKDVFFYEVFSGFRFAVIMLRLSDLLVGSDILPQESDMGTNNIATQLLTTMLELDLPA